MSADLDRSGSLDARSVHGDGELPFLARWSRRKLGQEVSPEPEKTATEPALALEPQASASPGPVPEAEAEQRIDPRTGKPLSELTDEDMPDIDTLDENADLSVFLAEKVSQALRTKALTKVFHSPKFNQICICAEYADDYTNFVPLGDIVPHDLKQAIVREGAKLLERFAERGLTITPDEAQARAAAEFRGDRMAEPDWNRVVAEAGEAGDAGAPPTGHAENGDMLHTLNPIQPSQTVLRSDTERT
ncbi:DUF3306 domain-containing protein [Rhodocyclaceae bacterium SMB388]